MAKIHIRYQSKGDVPANLAEFYSPIDPAKPDGPYVWSGFEPDPDGFALVNASKLQAELARLQADARRKDATLARFKKSDSDDLYSQEELSSMAAAITRVAELEGKVVNPDELRKQVAAELNRQFEAESKQLKAQLEAAKKESGHYQNQYVDKIRRTEAAAALAGFRPKKGLEEIAVERFMRDLDIVGQDDEATGFKSFGSRVKGQSGHRLNANGEPMSPREYAKEFVKSFGEMFEPSDSSTGTGHTGGGGGGGGAGANPPGGGKKGSGRFMMKQSEVLSNVGAYRDQLARTPKNDFLQIVNDQGQVVDARPGQGS